jgi:hypothetical protein
MLKTISPYHLTVGFSAALLFVCGCRKNEEPVTQSKTDIKAAVDKPVIFAAEPIFDFGTVKQGAEVEHIYKIKNTGDKDLIITKTVASCGCTASFATKDPIPPGKEGEVKAIFKTRGRRGRTSKRIVVSSNDPDTPKLYLTIKGDIIQDVELKPARLSFGSMLLGESAELKVELKLTRPEEVEITSVSSDDPRFTAKLIPGDGPGKSTVAVTFLGSDVQERINSSIKIALAGKDTTDALFPVRVQVVGNLQYPKRISLMKAGDVFSTRNINIVSREDKPFKIKRATDPDGRVKLSFSKKAEKKQRIVASVRDPEMSVDKTVRGTLHIRTTDPVDSFIEINYTISKRRRSSEIRDYVSKEKQNGRAAPLLKNDRKSGPAKKVPVV